MQLLAEHVRRHERDAILRHPEAALAVCVVVFTDDGARFDLPAERLSDLQQMLDSPEIKAIICARGGYGTVRIIDRIDFSSFINSPKWICGFSDVTVLHSHIHSNYGIETIHSAMPINFNDIPEDSQSVMTLKNALFGEELLYNIKSHPYNRKGETVGQLIGGNLSILYSLIGSSSDIDTKGKLIWLASTI